MSTDLDLYLPYDAGAGAAVAEAGWRSMMRRALGDGIIAGYLNELQVYADSSGMQVKVKTGGILNSGHYGENSSEKTLAVAANTSGSTRNDRVVVRNDFVNNKIVLDVLQGAPGAPALTQNSSIWELCLAHLTIPNGTTAAVTSGMVGDRRLFVHPYGPTGVASTNARDLWIPSPLEGCIVESRFDNGLYLYDGTAWNQLRRETVTKAYQPGGDQDTVTPVATWPTGLTTDVPVPSWATRARIFIKIGQVYCGGPSTANVDVSGYIGSILAATQKVRWVTSEVDSGNKRDLVFGGDVDVSSVAGTTQTIRAVANNASGSTVLRADADSRSYLEVEFR